MLISVGSFHGVAGFHVPSLHGSDLGSFGESGLDTFGFGGDDEFDAFRRLFG